MRSTEGLRHPLALFAGIVLALVVASTATACTRILWNTNSIAVMSSRSMDWWGSSQPRLHVLPRGIRKSGAFFGQRTVVTQNPVTWTSRYGSVVTSAYGTAIPDGMNEKGLAAHALWLQGSDYGPRDPSRAGVQAGLWVQYVLDNAETVKQAVALHPRIQPVAVSLKGINIPLALAIEDRTGDSAIIEYRGGQPLVYHGRDYRVMSNTPLDTALALLGEVDIAGATRNTPLPGNTNSLDRFVRASFYVDFLGRTAPRNRTEASAALMSVARNVSDPIGAPGDEPGETDETDYRTLSDLTNRTYAFEPTLRLATLRTDLRRLDFRRGAPALSLNPDNANLNGDITRIYRPGRTPPPGVRD
jgi:penicillin V acylase-like amidase (Ntn superfamily)